MMCWATGSVHERTSAWGRARLVVRSPGRRSRSDGIPLSAIASGASPKLSQITAAGVCSAMPYGLCAACPEAAIQYLVNTCC